MTEWVGQNNVDDVIEFVKGHVKVHEHDYAFYFKIDLHHFDEYTNSSHEGKNSGPKIVQVQWYKWILLTLQYN